MAKDKKSQLKPRAPDRDLDIQAALPPTPVTVVSPSSHPRPAYEAPSIDHLVAAVNDAAGAARTSWLGFVALIGYLLVTLASVTHLDLLLNSPLTLPVINVTIPLFSFFIFAPILLLVTHLWVLLHHATLRRRLWEADTRLDDPDRSDVRRIRFATTIVVEYFAGLRQGSVLRLLQAALTWGTLVVLPLLTLLFFQLRFLPYHSWEMTVWHRVCLFGDVVLVLAVAAYLGKSAVNWRYGMRRLWRGNMLASLVASCGLLLLSFVSLGLATHPDETARKWEASLFQGQGAEFLFGTGYDLMSKSSHGWLVRNLVLPDIDLAGEINRSSRKGGFDLRGRDLRYAILPNSNLSKVDAIGARFDYADLQSIDLSDAILSCAGRNHLSADKSQQLIRKEQKPNHPTVALDCFDPSLEISSSPSFRHAKLGKSRFDGAVLKGADFSFADLSKSSFRAVNAENSVFIGAKMMETDFALSRFSDAKFSGSAIVNVDATGADFARSAFDYVLIISSDFKGAEFFETRFEMAVFDSVDMRWARLSAKGDVVFLVGEEAYQYFVGIETDGTELPFEIGEDSNLGNSVGQLSLILVYGNIGDLTKVSGWQILDDSSWKSIRAGKLDFEVFVNWIADLPDWYVQTRFERDRESLTLHSLESKLDILETDDELFQAVYTAKDPDVTRIANYLVGKWVEASCKGIGGFQDLDNQWSDDERNYRISDYTAQQNTDFLNAIWLLNHNIAMAFEPNKLWNHNFVRIVSNECAGFVSSSSEEYPENQEFAVEIREKFKEQ